MTMFVERVESPIGTLLVVTTEADRAVAVEWADHEARLRRLLRLGDRAIETVLKERSGTSQVAVSLSAYLLGEIGALDDLDVAPRGTAFQQKVWTVLRLIPPGTTISYAALASRLGQPTAVRAVARANATNPISIVVPCHRVIGSSGALTGYAGGLARKQWLLDHEARWTGLRATAHVSAAWWNAPTSTAEQAALAVTDR